MTSTESPCVLFYVQHLLGIGHVKRAALIVKAISSDGIRCHVMLGGAPVSDIDWGNASTHQLPPITAADHSFSRYLTADGREPDEDYWRQRKEVLLSVIETMRPDVVLVEQYPFGRRKFRHEISAMIAHARAAQNVVKVIGSVRDVLVSSSRPEKAQFAVDVLRQDFDALLVHGDPSFIPFDTTFPMASEIADLIHYTGYVAPPAPAAIERSKEVIVSVGGGAVGGALLSVAMDARSQGLLDDRHWRFLIGPNLPDTVSAELRQSAPDNVTIEPNRPDYASLLDAAGISISQAGYNTLMDLVRTGCPAVVVPFAAPGETEQFIRAERLATNGFLQLIEEASLSTQELADAVTRAIAGPAPTSPPFKMKGDRESARLIRSISGW